MFPARGYDWRDQLEQMAIEKETAEKLGLTLAIHTPISVQAALSNHVDNNNDESEEEENAGSDEQE